ncbi:metallophosphoesterase [Candidatus Woesearchaeota archaeon]|nr:metallophosphoesterase [Candidatus Woesearchaeota archaeon]
MAVGADLILETQGKGLISRLLSSSKYPDAYARDGGLVVLPSRGKLYVASDFHSRSKDFEKWLQRTELVERMQYDDVYGLILGDVVDKKEHDSEAERYGDSKIVDRIMEIQDKLGEQRNRLIYIQGNHEHEVLKLYDMLRSRGMGPANQKKIVQRMYNGKSGFYFKQFNFIERMTEEQFRYMRDLPFAVMTKNGIVGVHAGPARFMEGPEDVAQKKKSVVQDIVWRRPENVTGGSYTSSEVREFLEKMDDSGLLVTGHTPLGMLPRYYVENGVGVYGGNQIILATSYGSYPGNKSYLALELGKRYNNTGDVRAGEEIARLEIVPGTEEPQLLAKKKAA